VRHIGYILQTNSKQKKPNYLIGLYCFSYWYNLFGQTNADSISSINNKFYYHNKKISTTQLYDIISINPEVRKEMRNATLYSITVGIIGGVGILNICYPLGMAFAGYELNVVNMAVGVTLIGLSILFAIANKRQLKKAIKHYNDRLKPMSYKPNSFKLMATMHTLQLNFTF
jgi:hypothetical protein